MRETVEEKIKTLKETHQMKLTRQEEIVLALSGLSSAYDDAVLALNLIRTDKESTYELFRENALCLLELLNNLQADLNDIAQDIAEGFGIDYGMIKK